jgi:hypothetical protein
MAFESGQHELSYRLHFSFLPLRSFRSQRRNLAGLAAKRVTLRKESFCLDEVIEG